MIYPFFLYVNYLSSSDIDKIKELIYSHGRERLLIAVDLTFALYITCSILLVSTGSDVRGPIFYCNGGLSPNGNNLEPLFS
mgnify:FL=1